MREDVSKLELHRYSNSNKFHTDFSKRFTINSNTGR